MARDHSLGNIPLQERGGSKEKSHRLNFSCGFSPGISTGEENGKKKKAAGFAQTHGLVKKINSNQLWHGGAIIP